MSRNESSNNYIEKWDRFGSNIERYIRQHEEELSARSYDVILGFSRGGAILAHTFSCLLKEILISEYSNPYKASVRPIPKGITVKGNDPCFIMDRPSAPQEESDILCDLENDLTNFSQEYNNGKSINILIMDDNLTGATRLKFLKDKLREMKCVANHETLAYVRHNRFKKIKTIIEFPDGADYFVMPWHIDHGKRNLDVPNDDNDLEYLKLFIKSDDGWDKLVLDISSFKSETRNQCIIQKNLIINGAGTSGFYVDFIKKDGSNFIELDHTLFMLYPPKKCLKPLNNNFEYDNGFHELCSFNLGEPTKPSSMGVCVACSCLNCNKSLIQNLLLANEKVLLVEAKSNRISNIQQEIVRWFKQTMPNIIIEEHD